MTKRIEGKEDSVLPEFEKLMRGRGRYGLLYAYVGREYLLSFAVAFLFFFFIFFINQILVLAQRILLRNVNLPDVLLLVVYSIPQFLMYTMPFSSLASASMVIGNLSSQNEILALRSAGVHLNKIFRPILIISLVFSSLTLIIANRMIPYTTKLYKELYSNIIQSVPTLEIKSYSSTKFGKKVISNGLAEGNVLHDVLIFEDSDKKESRVVSAKEGRITVIDINRSLYRIDLTEPRVLLTDSFSLESYSLASASEMSLYLDLSSAVSGYVNITPSQMSVSELYEAASQLKDEQNRMEFNRGSEISGAAQKLGEALMSLEKGNAGTFAVPEILGKGRDLKNSQSAAGYSFYYQYYRSELQKKIALSLACTFLVFIAFPLSFFRVRYGRLIGFGLSMFIAAAYWFFLYFMHVKAISSPLHPAFFIWAPDAVVFAAGLLLLWRTGK